MTASASSTRTPPRREWVAFLTGASSGIGMGLARALAGRGQPVVLFARRADRLASIVEAIEAIGGQALATPGDVTSEDDLARAVSAGVERFGRIDLAVANAGISGDHVPGKTPTSETMRVLDVNLGGVVRTLDAVLPGMLERGWGHLVTISSLAGYRGLPTAAPYCASKAAVNAYTETLRIDLARSGIDVTLVCPGFIETELTAARSHAMPQLMTLEQGTRAILRGIDRRAPEISFPAPLSWWVRLGRLLPNRLYDRAVMGFSRRMLG